MWVFEPVSGSESHFYSGYGAHPLTTKEGRLRYHVALGIELLSGLAYWKKTGQFEMLEDYQRRFRHWCTQS
jgi:hypothetical protein